MRTFSSAITYQKIIDSLGNVFPDAGYKKFSRGYKKKLPHAVCILELRKSRDTRADRLIVGLHAEICLTKLNPIFRSSSFNCGIQTAMPYDFALYQSEMDCSHNDNGGYWMIYDDVSLQNVISQARKCVPSCLEFFSEFYTENQVLEKMRRRFTEMNSMMLNEKVKYPAYLALIGQHVGFKEVMNRIIDSYEPGSPDRLRAMKYIKIIEKFVK